MIWKLLYIMSALNGNYNLLNTSSPIELGVYDSKESCMAAAQIISDQKTNVVALAGEGVDSMTRLGMAGKTAAGLCVPVKTAGLISK